MAWIRFVSVVLIVGYGRFLSDQNIRDATFSKYWLPAELG